MAERSVEVGDVWDDAEAVAARAGESMSEVIERALAEYVAAGGGLTVEQSAARAQVSAANWRGWRTRRVPKSNPVPEPDVDGKRWYPRTVDAWTARRKGSPAHLRPEERGGNP